MTADETIEETARMFAAWNLEYDRQRGVEWDAQRAEHYRKLAWVDRYRVDQAGLPREGAGRGYEIAAEMIEAQLLRAERKTA